MSGITTGFVLVIGVLFIVMACISLQKSSGEHYNQFYNLYGWRTNPPPNYPQQIMNTPFDKVMTDCCQKCNSNLLRSYDFDGKFKTDCLMNCKLKASEAQGTLMGPPVTSLKEGYGWVPSTNLRNGVFCFDQGGCVGDDQSCTYL